jgi:hypothetical protein
MPMNRCPFVALGATPLVFTFLVSGCGDYSQPKDTPTGGSGGTAPTGGSGGTAQSGSGGTGGTGQSGSGGTAGTGQAGSGAGGASGQAGGGAGGAAAGGSGGGQASCDDVAPCGGDAIGTWTVASCMLDLTGNVDLTGLGLANDCMSTPLSSGSLAVSGTLTIVAGGTFMDATTTCAMIANPIKSVGFTTLTCVDNTTTMGCTCSGTIQQTGGMAFVSFDPAMSGTFTSAGNNLTMTAFGQNVEYSYCVAGNTLTMTPVTVNKTGTVEGPIVLTK